MEIDASKLDEEAAYKLLVGAVVPRPIAWVTSISPNGKINAAPFSCYTFVSNKPPMLAISIGRSKGALKHTSRNARDRGEFVVNVVHESQLEPMHQCSRDYPDGTSEVEAAGLTLTPGVRIKTPRLAAAPISMECRFAQIIEFGELRSTLVVGEVIHFTVRDELLVDGRIDTELLRPLARLGGPRYARLGEIITLSQLHVTTQAPASQQHS